VGAKEAGAEVRLRHVEELASELVIFAEPVLGTASLPKSPTPRCLSRRPRLGRPGRVRIPHSFRQLAAQLKQFIDQAGALWQRGDLVDKVATAFTCRRTLTAASMLDHEHR
jgi:NAD(P)H dehydrogenase (quinone)